LLAYAAGQTAMDLLTRWSPEAKAAVWTALFTFGLLAVAIVTAYIGLGALHTANATFQLEARPVVTVDRSCEGTEAPEILGVVDLNLANGRLGLRSPSGHEGRCANGLIAISNVGRSPAIDLELWFNIVSTPVLSHEAHKGSKFSVKWPGLRSGGTVYFKILNHSRDDVTIAALRASQANSASPPERIPLPLVSLWGPRALFIEGL
jgi:hypothetical protein